jgi:hypothetical protein
MRRIIGIVIAAVGCLFLAIGLPLLLAYRYICPEPTAIDPWIDRIIDGKEPLKPIKA